MTEVVQEIITHDRDEPIMKSGAVSHNHKPVSRLESRMLSFIQKQFLIVCVIKSQAAKFS